MISQDFQGGCFVISPQSHLYFWVQIRQTNGLINEYIIFEWRNSWQLIDFQCPVQRETIKIKVLILWFWSKANAPTQETEHTEGSAYIGNASICASTFSIFLCPVSLLVSPHLNFSYSLLPLPICSPPVFLSLSFSFAASACSLSPFLSSILLPYYLPAPSPPTSISPPSPPLHPSVSTRQRVIHLHWGDTCAVLTVRALTEREEGKQQPHDSKDTLSVGKHIRPSITEAGPTPPTLWVLAVVTAVWLNDPASLERC